MRGFKALLKKEVMSLKSGCIVGGLKDIYFGRHGRLLYIVVKTGSFLNADRIYGISNVNSFTKDSIEIKDEMRIEAKPSQEFLSAADALGLIVKSEDRIWGMSDDIYFDFRERRVTGIGISKGFLMDIYSGMQIIPFEGTDIGKNIILCPSQRSLKVYNGGIKNIIKREE